MKLFLKRGTRSHHITSYEHNLKLTSVSQLLLTPVLLSIHIMLPRPMVFLLFSYMPFCQQVGDVGSIPDLPITSCQPLSR